MNSKKRWLEVTIPASSALFDALENFLFEIGSRGTLETENGISGYFNESLNTDDIKNSIQAYIRNLRALGHSVQEPVYQSIEEEDWGKNWRKYFTAVEVTPYIVVKPPWIPREAREGQIIIDITPRMAFGTGTHETTQLCLEFLGLAIHKGDRVLDIGTGSGILAIASVKMGAAEVLGIDIDENAIQNANENIKQNGVGERIRIRHDTIDSVPQNRYNVICANIDTKTLTPILTRLKALLYPGGHLILSGILHSEEKTVTVSALKSGFTAIDNKQRGEWSGLLLKRPSGNKEKEMQ